MNKKVAIYGAGAFGKTFFEALEGKVDFFIDDYYESKTYLDKAVVQLNELDKECLIYISVLQHSKKIEAYLQENNFTNVYNFTKSIQTIPNILHEIAKTDYLWLTQEREKMLNIEKLQEVSKLLCDEKSKLLLERIIKLRQTLDCKYYIEPEGVEYFCDDVPILDNLETIHFVDCGAYTGDSVAELMKQNKSVASSVSFEPDVKNLKALQKQLEILKKEHPQTNFFIYPSGVYSHNATLRFSNSGVDSSAHFDETSDVSVNVLALDETLQYSDVNFIKMDIEGAEKAALEGAKKIKNQILPSVCITNHKIYGNCHSS